MLALDHRGLHTARVGAAVAVQGFSGGRASSSDSKGSPEPALASVAAACPASLPGGPPLGLVQGLLDQAQHELPLSVLPAGPLALPL